MQCPWTTVDATSGVDDTSTNRKPRRMRDNPEHPAEDLPSTEPESLRPANRARYKLYVKPAPRIRTVLKDCGDCETDGFGSTFGFSPR
jgi:hypothetical protein